MADQVEITDRDSARAWLETQEHQTQVWFASRCALRTLPVLGNWSDATTSGLAFVTCRVMLISAAAATCPAAEMKKLESAATAARSAAAAFSDTADSTAARYAAAAFSDSADSTTAHYAAAGFSDSADSTAAFSADANAPENWRKLWHDAEQQPDLVTQAWQGLKAQWEADAADWSFWITWYEAILNGAPLDWTLTHRIALEVTDEQWDAGPEVVADQIRAIETDFDKKSGGDTPQPAGDPPEHTPEPTEAQKKSTVRRVSENRDAIAFAVAGLLAQLGDYRERVRGQNSLDPDYRDELLGFIDALSGKLHELLSMLPSEQETLEPERGGTFIGWLRESKALVPGVAKHYVEPLTPLQVSLLGLRAG